MADKGDDRCAGPPAATVAMAMSDPVMRTRKRELDGFAQAMAVVSIAVNGIRAGHDGFLLKRVYASVLSARRCRDKVYIE